jgi:uncharacterized membrane protein YhhN
MWLLITIVFAIFEWIGEAKEKSWVIYFSKPLVIISLLIWIFTTINLPQFLNSIGRNRLVWFVVGLFFCLLGDIFLMLPSKFFMAGLIAFLLCHIFYIIGIGPIFPKENDIVPALLLIILIGIVSLSVFRKLFQGLSLKKLDYMRMPVLLYSIIISVMLYVATITLLDNDWNYQNAFMVSAGALVFYFSDILNAWLRFVSHIPAGRLKIMMTYHIGQILLVMGMVSHYSNYLNSSL